MAGGQEANAEGGGGGITMYRIIMIIIIITINIVIALLFMRLHHKLYGNHSNDTTPLLM